METNEIIKINKEEKIIVVQNYIKWFFGLSIMASGVFGNSYYAMQPLLYRVLGVVVVFLLGLVVIINTTEGREAMKIILDSRTEIRRVIWPTRVETIQTTLIVLVAITIAGVMLWAMDSLFGWATASLLG